MKFKDYIKEAVIDIPKRTYAKGVFDEADTDNPKLKDSVKSMIDNILTFDLTGSGESEAFSNLILGLNKSGIPYKLRKQNSDVVIAITIYNGY